MSLPSMKVISDAALEDAFTEWMRRYREDPEQFDADWLEAGPGDATYGQRASAYLLKILRSRGGVATLAENQSYLIPFTVEKVGDPEWRDPGDRNARPDVGA